jgi:hypothetical protein
MIRHRDLYYVYSLVRRTIKIVLPVDRGYSLMVSAFCLDKELRHTSCTLWEDCGVDGYLMSHALRRFI